MESKIIELEAANVEQETKNTQLEEHIAQLDESVAMQLKNQHPPVRFNSSRLNKILI